MKNNFAVWNGVNLAICLSLSRILLSFVFMFCLSCSTLFYQILALFFFTLAVITDIYDGSFARSKNMVTPLGIFLDPLADKILISCAFISFVGIEDIFVPAWMVAIIISREFAITGLRLLGCSQGKILPAERHGKRKTIFQMGAIFIILLYLIARTLSQSLGLWKVELEIFGRVGVYTIMVITLILTILSGYFYLHKHRNMFLK